MLLGWMAGCGPARPRLAGESVSAVDRAEAASLLETVLAQGRLSGMRWAEWPSWRGEVERFYRERELEPVWSQNGKPTPEARALIARFEQAEEMGLASEDYDGPRWRDRVLWLDKGWATAERLVQLDVALTVSLFRYVQDLRTGWVDPAKLGFGSRAELPPLDLTALASRLSTAADPGPELEALGPPLASYRALLAALPHVRELAKGGDEEPFPGEETVHPGERYAELPRLARYLERLGDLPAGAAAAVTDDLYGEPLVTAVKSFQRLHGLEPDGNLGAKTLAQLSVPLSWRVRQLELNLVRLRWRQLDYSRPAVVVNVPEFRLRCYDGSEHEAFRSDVVVGEVGEHATPILTAKIYSVLFRPAWNVPTSIAAKEEVPEILKDPTHFAKSNFEIVGAESQEPTPEVLAAVARGTLRLRQRPGPKNSLGLVKFVMPNPYDIYLHATPATALFLREHRALSHGCVRVADPVGLALWLLRDQKDWTAERVKAAMKEGKDEQPVFLTSPVAVFTAYRTATADENGEVHFFEDFYLHDARLEAALAQPHP
ncbi:MAG: L,D-transpeptidase family protein [Thermoanaerobaculia bacterium]